MMDENKAKRRSGSDTEVHKRQRGKNLAVLGILLFLVALIYVIAMVRMTGGAFP